MRRRFRSDHCCRLRLEFDPLVANSSPAAPWCVRKLVVRSCPTRPTDPPGCLMCRPALHLDPVSDRKFRQRLRRARDIQQTGVGVDLGPACGVASPRDSPPHSRGSRLVRALRARAELCAHLNRATTDNHSSPGGERLAGVGYSDTSAVRKRRLLFDISCCVSQ